MIKIKQLLAFILIGLNFILGAIEAVQLKTKFYLAKDLPKEYSKPPYDGDATVITLQDWPEDSIISVTEKRLLLSERTKNFTWEPGHKNPIQVISSIGYVPGVPVTFTFQDDSKSLKKYITIIPNRIHAKSSIDNAQIEAELIMENPANYKITLQGFGDDEKLTLKSVSYHEKLRQKLPMAKNLSEGFALMPGVINKQGGVATASFIRPSGEILKLELPWGMEWAKYELYFDEEGTVKSIIEAREFRKEHPLIAEYFDSMR